jgi:hypothetical protein
LKRRRDFSLGLSEAFKKFHWSLALPILWQVEPTCISSLHHSRSSHFRVFPGLPVHGENALPDPFGHVEEIPLPGLTVVGRKRLTPDRTLLVPRVPAEDNDDRLSFEGVFGKKMADTIFK